MLLKRGIGRATMWRTNAGFQHGSWKILHSMLTGEHLRHLQEATKALVHKQESLRWKCLRFGSIFQIFQSCRGGGTLHWISFRKASKIHYAVYKHPVTNLSSNSNPPLSSPATTQGTETHRKMLTALFSVHKLTDANSCHLHWQARQ